MAATLAKIKWTTNILHELCYPFSKLTILYDNLSVVLLVANPIMHCKTKYFDLELHFVWDSLQQKQLQLLHTLDHLQMVDVFTKSLFGSSLYSFKDKLMVVPNSTISLRGMLHTLYVVCYTFACNIYLSSVLVYVKWTHNNKLVFFCFLSLLCTYLSSLFFIIFTKNFLAYGSPEEKEDDNDQCFIRLLLTTEQGHWQWQLVRCSMKSNYVSFTISWFWWSHSHFENQFFLYYTNI